MDTSYIDLPYVSLKRTKISKVGYPVVSVAAIVKDNWIRVAFSGVCDYPFRSDKIEKILNDTSLPVDERVEKAVAHLPSVIVDDIQGSRRIPCICIEKCFIGYVEGIGDGKMITRNGASRALIHLHVNGETREAVVRSADTLLYTLREELGLTGAKRACENGDCGACTVLVNGELHILAFP